MDISQDELSKMLSSKHKGSMFDTWRRMAANGELEGKEGFTFYAFSDQLCLLQNWIEGDEKAFDLVKEAVKRWQETGGVPPRLDWRYWKAHDTLPPLLIEEGPRK